MSISINNATLWSRTKSTEIALKTDSFSDLFFKTSSDTSCGGEWSAARNTERKRKSVDDTGLYVASCRHQYGLKSINMKRGEIYAYPAYLLTNFILPNKVEYLFTDVMCKLWPYLCKVDSNLPSKIKGALSVMHAKGHNLRCQVRL